MSEDLLKLLNKKIVSSYKELPLVDTKEDFIPGEGSVRANIFMIGEAPGYQETVERRPFVGRSGKLLREVIDEVGLDLSNIYISNIVKARPPENRDPSSAEINAFKPFLDEEIKIIDPKLIVTLGRFSMDKFLPKVKISEVHGKLQRIEWEGQIRFILPMYHPAAALRGTKVKNMFINDFKKIKKIVRWLERDDTRNLGFIRGMITG
ncbi:MAG: uracil-DNA glycosylase [Candidatus Pacebacteria bacterium]|nr:uracil-DNA glycosylase [Candidatus Paceibacterota bacterium]